MRYKTNHLLKDLTVKCYVTGEGRALSCFLIRLKYSKVRGPFPLNDLLYCQMTFICLDVLEGQV